MMELGVVIVTFNRLEKLKKALKAYETQTRRPERILVVDNCSTDGTDAYLQKWLNDKEQGNKNPVRKTILRLHQNIGGSGGFYCGLRRAVELGMEWIFLADDDAYPQPDCLEKLLRCAEAEEHADAAAFCSSVLVKENIDTWHRRRLFKRYGIVREERIPEEEYRKESFPLELFSYVGVLLSRDAILKAGYPEKAFFISYDDSEHSLRIAKQGRILCIPAARVEHDTEDNFEDVISWKRYYNIRNKLYSYRRHFGLVQAGMWAAHYLWKYRGQSDNRRMTLAAVKDAFFGRLGLHSMYRPGWHPVGETK